MKRAYLHICLACASLFALAGCPEDTAPAIPPTPPTPPTPPSGQLVRQDVEPAGTNCPNGGTAIHTGRDDDGDGLLDHAEIDATSYACIGIETRDEVWIGDFTEADWADAEKLARLEHAKVVTGSLALPAEAAVDLASLLRVDGDLVLARRSAGDSVVTLSALEGIGGDLVIGSESRGRLALPALRDVNGSLHLEGDLGALTLPRLESLDADLLLDGRSLSTLDLPALAVVGGAIRVGRTPLRALDLPALAHVGGAISVIGATQLESLGLDALTQVGEGVSLIEVGLEELDLPALQTLEVLAVSDCPALRRIAVPELALLSDGVYVEHAARLESFAMPELDSAEYVRFEDTPALAHLDLATVSRLRSIHLIDVGIPDLSTFRHLLSVDQGIKITKANQLHDLRGLEGITRTQSLEISQCASLTSLDGTQGLTALGQVYVFANPSLTSIAALAQLSYVDGHAQISNNALASFAGLEALLGVNGTLTLREEGITSLAPLAALCQVRSQLNLTLPNVPDAEQAELRTRVGQ